MILKPKQFIEVKDEKHLKILNENNNWDIISEYNLTKGKLFIGKEDGGDWYCAVTKGHLERLNYTEVFEEETSEEEAQGSEAFQRAKEKQKKASGEISENQYFLELFKEIANGIVAGDTHTSLNDNEGLARNCFFATKACIDLLKKEGKL